MTGAESIQSMGNDEAPTTKEESSNKIRKVWPILAALVLIILFLILVTITSFLIKYYLAMREEISHLKDHDEVKQHLLQEIKAVNKTLDIICTQCPAGWMMSDSSCYYVSEDKASWEEARDKCSEMNSVLVMIKDKTESDTLNKLYKMSRRYWIGMRRDLENIQIWKWLDGTQVTFTNWYETQPDNFKDVEHCGESQSGPWNDLPCDEMLFYICKLIRT